MNDKLLVDRAADMCGDQLPIYSNVGRGLEGESFYIELATDSDDSVILKGMKHDPATDRDTQVWITKNINGGSLSYSYKESTTMPGTFNLTITYTRADHPDDNWSWTSPNIPYIDGFNLVDSTSYENVTGFDYDEQLAGTAPTIKEYIDAKFAELRGGDI